MTELLQWLTRYSPEVALLVASGAALLFIVRLIVEKSIVPYVDEKVRAVRYQRNFNYAQDILNYDQSQKGLRVWKTLLLTGLIHALERDKLSKTEKSLGIMAELARNYPYRTQEIIDEICRFIRNKWNKNTAPAEKWNKALVLSLRILSSLPKMDQNKYPYYVELTNLRLRHIDLKGINFENFVLWETEFVGVNMTRSNFRNTDLGGCTFTRQTSVEWSDFSGALMNVAFMSGVVTTFDQVQLWGSKFEESRIDKCKMIISDGFDVTGIKAKFGDRLEVEYR
jgi:uncharacterized protein YjbI with pentapeptide repeats